MHSGRKIFKLFSKLAICGNSLRVQKSAVLIIYFPKNSCSNCMTWVDLTSRYPWEYGLLQHRYAKVGTRESLARLSWKRVPRGGETERVKKISIQAECHFAPAWLLVFFSAAMPCDVKSLTYVWLWTVCILSYSRKKSDLCTDNFILKKSKQHNVKKYVWIMSLSPPILIHCSTYTKKTESNWVLVDAAS